MLQQPRSQLGQDELVARHFGYKRGGYFVEAGAADGIYLSNTYALEQELGWTGLCVEPNPALFARLVQHRGCRTEPRCLVPPGHEAGGRHRFRPAGLLGGSIAGYSDEHVLTSPVPEITVDHATLPVILDDAGAPRLPHLIDYLSLDIEGGEHEVLNDPALWARYRFRVMTIEHNSYLGAVQQARRERLHQLLSGLGYQITPLGHDDFYVWTGAAR